MHYTFCQCCLSSPSRLWCVTLLSAIHLLGTESPAARQRWEQIQHRTQLRRPSLLREHQSSTTTYLLLHCPQLLTHANCFSEAFGSHMIPTGPPRVNKTRGSGARRAPATLTDWQPSAPASRNLPAGWRDEAANSGSFGTQTQTQNRRIRQ